jgi:hypothetical protein
MLVIENGLVHFFIVEDSALPKEFIKKQHISFEVPNLKEIMNTLTAMGVNYKEGKTDVFVNNNYHWC